MSKTKNPSTCGQVEFMVRQEPFPRNLAPDREIEMEPYIREVPPFLKE